jgi:ABC-type Fe3+-siderophore transport system permease subunit
MSKAKDFRNFVYNIENIVDEFVIVILSLGAIVVSVYSVFFTSQGPNFIEFGRVIFPWITMLALMIIGRELWLMNRKLTTYLEQKGDD